MVYHCFEAKKFQSIFDNISKPIALVFSHNLVDKKDVFCQSIFDNISKPIALVFSHNLVDKKEGILIK